jgi:predicted short-subunit dehydrogenase-like oxidoreductase (DUF2520 family)
VDREEALRSKLADRYLTMRELERNQPRRAAEQASLPPIALIGNGRLGGAIAAAAPPGLELLVAGRDDLDQACRGAEAALLCVPDGEIPAAAERAAAHVPPLRFVGHTSGAGGLAELAAASRAGAETFSLHPLQTVPDRGSSLTGAPAAIAGSTPAALALARSLAEVLGMRPFEVPEDARATYHAAASIASNLLVALEESAAQLLERAGIEDGRALLTPLVLRTAANWAERGEAALTGPIARGDEETVRRHLGALAATAPELEPLYEALAERTRALAAREKVGS